MVAEGSQRILAVALDVDGTIVTEHGKIEPALQEALRHRWSDILFILATARSQAGLRPLYDVLSVDGPHLALNGAVIYQSINQSAINTSALPKGVYDRLINFFHKHASSIMAVFAYTSTTWYAFGEDEAIRSEADTVGNKPLLHSKPLGHLTSPCLKLTFIARNATAAVYLECLARSSFPNLSIFRSKSQYVEITNGSATKGNALQQLCRILSIDQIIAIGDGLNDVSMFQVSTKAYAVAEAPEAVRACADIVLPAPSWKSITDLILALDYAPDA